MIVSQVSFITGTPFRRTVNGLLRTRVSWQDGRWFYYNGKIVSSERVRERKKNILRIREGGGGRERERGGENERNKDKYSDMP